MQIRYFKQYSPAVNRDMEIKVYGFGGIPILYIPCQDGRFVDFENFHMAEYFSEWIDSGKCCVFSIDTMDKETWSATYGDGYWRIRRYEQWINYITEEVVPFMNATLIRNEYTDKLPGALVFGCSLGATHAANLYLRRPDLFGGALALSGLYSSSYGFGDYMDDVVYLNSPVNYIPNMPEDHPYMEMYRQRKAVICVGQGAWEMPDFTRDLQRATDSKNIPIWYDYWGYDCNHDWDWWYKQVVYFMPWFFGEK